MTYIVCILLLLWNVEYLTMDELVRRVMSLRQKGDFKLPEASVNTVQSVINRHTSQSSEWKKNGSLPEDDLLYSPMGKGSGTWGIKHRGRARQKLEHAFGVSPEQLDALLAEVKKKLP